MDSTAASQAIANGDVSALLLALGPDQAYEITVAGNPEYMPMFVALLGPIVAASREDGGIGLLALGSPQVARERFESNLSDTVSLRFATIRDLVTDDVVHQGDDNLVRALLGQHIGLMPV